MSLKRNVLDLRKRKEIVLQGGGEEAIKKQAAMGKLTATVMRQPSPSTRCTVMAAVQM